MQGTGLNLRSTTHNDLNAAPLTAREPLLGSRSNHPRYFIVLNEKTSCVCTTAQIREEMVQEVGFEPTKHYALGPKPSPFDRSGTPA